MEIGVEPKIKSIKIVDFKSFYELRFNNDEIILWIKKEDLTLLRDRINEILKGEIGEDNKFDMLREVQDYKDEVRRVGGKVD